MAHARVSSSRDSTFPVDGAILPGGGSLVKMLEFAIGQYVSLSASPCSSAGQSLTLLFSSVPPRP